MGVYRALAIGFVLCANTLLVASVRGQQSDSTIPADLSKKILGWLEAFNSGDFAQMEQVHVSAGGDPAQRQILLRQYEMYLVSHGVDPEKTESTGTNRVTITGTERLSGDTVNLMIDTSGGVPKLGGFRLVRGPESESGFAKLPEADALKALDANITHRSEADEFSGAVLVAKDGETLFKKAWGLANKTTGAKNQVDTKFNLASAGKMFTAVSILQLAQAGKLSLDDTVGKHLPDYKNADVRDKVTIRQLLSHTSGMGDIFGEEFDKRRGEIRTVADWVSLFETAPLKFAPGTRWAYSNAGFCLLGAIIESASGENYFDYLDRHIFAPAGMKNTGAFETDKPNENLATGYTRVGATTPEQVRDRLENTNLHSVKGSPAGGSYSTAEDMALFANALLGHKLINEEYTALALTRQTQSIPNSDPYGFGFAVDNVNGHKVVGHGGGFPGISSSIDIFPDDGYVVIVFSNYDMVARRYAMQMRDWIGALP